MGRLTQIGVCVLAGAIFILTIMLAPSAFAAVNNGPSKAVGVKVGVPFTGSWPGTKMAYEGNEWFFNHWWRPPAMMRPGDELQLAVDNRSGSERIYLCLTPPVDDFGANDALANCSDDNYVSPTQERINLTYGGPSGLPFLVVATPFWCECDPTGLGQYTITIERMITLVNIGLVVPSVIPATFSLPASLTYGDNTPVADGVPATLQWRQIVPGSKPLFADFAATTSVGGMATFAGTMPTAAQGARVQLRACVAQPGGESSRCTKPAKTTVAISACARAEARRLTYARAVHRLRLKLRRAHGRVAQNRLKRRLKSSHHQLVMAGRSIRANCV